MIRAMASSFRGPAMKKSPKKQRLSVYLEPDVMKALSAHAARRGLSLSLVAEAGIASFLSSLRSGERSTRPEDHGPAVGRDLERGRLYAHGPRTALDPLPILGSVHHGVRARAHYVQPAS
ncbi:hypothetical protein CHELA40_13979 [Chelatococcus asaccharovorans]|nr:hypothetical protein CHELA17_61648 [Chelatococcus asaccharovorans]CAH1674324.1 hypothetical protein CHELA40_13979 [Chelatococcus asaccharovorans]